MSSNDFGVDHLQRVVSERVLNVQFVWQRITSQRRGWSRRRRRLLACVLCGPRRTSPTPPAALGHLPVSVTSYSPTTRPPSAVRRRVWRDELIAHLALTC